METSPARIQAHALPRQRQREMPIARYALGILVSVAIALAVGYALLRPPMPDLVQLTLLLSATAALSFLVGAVAYRWRWVDRTPRLSYAVLGSSVLATALTILREHPLVAAASMKALPARYPSMTRPPASKLARSQGSRCPGSASRPWSPISRTRSSGRSSGVRVGARVVNSASPSTSSR